MPTPVNSNWRKKSMRRAFGRGRGSPLPVLHGEGKSSIRKLDVLVEHDRPLLVAHDVVAVEAVAVLVEIVFALGALVALGREDRGADLVGVGRAGLVDGGREH